MRFSVCASRRWAAWCGELPDILQVGFHALPAVTGEPGPHPVTCLAAGRDSCGAVGIVHKTGPLAKFLTEQPSVWRPHVEEDPFGRTGRGPADCRGRRGRAASGAGASTT